MQASIMIDRKIAQGVCGGNRRENVRGDQSQGNQDHVT
jgi:hypothetical protein